MASIYNYSYVLATVNGRKYEFGSLTTPTTIAAAGDDVYELITSVAVSTSIKIFDVDEDLADFDFLLVAADWDLQLQVVVDDDGDVGEAAFTLPVEGSGTTGTWGPPVIFASDDSYANYTVDFAGGTLDVIERLNVKNNSATQAAQVVCLAFT
jgi:hypothetical protein